MEWSAELMAIYGLDAGPADEAAFTAFVHPDDRTRVEAETSSFLETGATYEHEFRIVRRDGAVRVINDRGVIKRSADGKAISLCGLNIDVTAQRMPAVDREGQDRLSRFRALADNIDQLAWMADGDGFIYWYNRRWFDYTGAAPEAMRGWGWTKVHHPDHVDRVVDRISRHFKSGEPWEDTFPLRRHDGAWRWFLSRAQPVRNAAGRITHWFGTNTDVTDRLEAEERIRRSEERFKRVADSMPQLVWSAEADGEVFYYNRQAANFTPMAHTAAGGFDWSVLVHPDDLAPTQAAWIDAVAAGGEYSCEHRLRMADGTWRWHLSRAVPGPNDRDGGGVTWYGTATDVHELKQLQEHRLLLSQELDHRMKNALTLVQSIANQTFRAVGGGKEAVGAFNARLRALAAANDILVSGHWSEADVGMICRRTIAPLGIDARVAMEGEPIKLPPRMGFLLSLGLHELATNALKHGSLSVPDGRVALRWQRVGDDRFHLRWEEAAGPPVSPPSAEGFGSRLLKAALAQEIGGQVDLDYDAAGLVCRIDGATG